MDSSKKTCFLVSFKDPKDSSTIELKVKEISDSNLGLGFVRLSNFIFEPQGLVVDPEVERLQKRYADVNGLHISIYSILSILEVGFENKGLNFKRDKSNVLVLPQDGSGKTPPPMN